MSLVQRCDYAFAVKVAGRGENYARRGKIQIDEAAELRVRARVRGTSTYALSLAIDLDDNTIELSCSCPYAREDPCKHLWALLCVLDRDKPGRYETPGGQRMHVILVRQDGIEIDFGLDLDEVEGRAGALPATPVRSKWTAPRERAGNTAPRRGGRSAAGPDWKERLVGVLGDLPSSPHARGDRILEYRLDIGASRAAGRMVVRFFERQRRADGTPGAARPARVAPRELRELSREDDRRALSLMLSVVEAKDDDDDDAAAPWRAMASSARPVSVASLGEGAIAAALPALCDTGRFGLAGEGDELTPLGWDGKHPYELRVCVEPAGKTKRVRARGYLERGDEDPIALSEALWIHPGGAVVFGDRIAVMDPRAALLARELSEAEGFEAKAKEAPALARALVDALGGGDAADKLEIEPSVSVSVARGSPDPRVRFDAPFGERGVVPAQVDFRYGDARVEFDEPELAVAGERASALIARDIRAERAALEVIEAAGVSPPGSRARGAAGQVWAENLAEVARCLLERGIDVEARGRPLRPAGSIALEVSSGIDWFDLEAEGDFGGEPVELPTLLRAIRDGQRFVPLGDGSAGIVPEAWLQRFGVLAKVAGESAEASGGEGALRFHRCQALLLDALLADEEARVDAGYAAWRRRIRRGAELKPQRAPRGFRGELRAYQKEGLGWLRFLESAGLGGCLADDMGLGKTVQVLAHLVGRRQRRRRAKKADRPSLVVAPRSLLANWESEAARFSPGLSVLVHHGPERYGETEPLAECDLIVTTYATLRQDIELFRDLELDWAILDEAQAIKNADSQAAKACRLLGASHRLALTGTPVENHLTDLVSIFEFLNPGLLSASPALTPRALRSPDEDTLALLSRALRPVLLRRAKEDVLGDLPPKVEQTVPCELSGAQERRYRALRDYYRSSLKSKIGPEGRGLPQSKIQVLEALLRLRQAACHPGLLDRKRKNESSPKLDALVERLHELSQNGHKALVFSQFTTFLGIVKRRLEDEGIRYVYLDGRTRDRAARVAEFQNDPSARVFLLSLKAAGHGLNLTAADYVFLLDPWWNPAVEAQAIDRAHRIGQERKVFTYRLIAKDTVEEKVRELQAGKRELAEAVVQRDASLLADMSPDDLELLLS